MVRGLKFCIQVGEGLNYPCSEKKGTDQLCGYREADLQLCFHLCKVVVFSCTGSCFKFQFMLVSVSVYMIYIDLLRLHVHVDYVYFKLKTMGLCRPRAHEVLLS